MTGQQPEPVLQALHAAGRIAADWCELLAPVSLDIDYLVEAVRREEQRGVCVLPPEPQRFRAFERPLSELRVLIVGQDPYPTPGHAVGLAFATHPDVQPLPRSLANIFRELQDDQQLPPPTTGSLDAWVAQGVCLLNRVLTVRAGETGSHRRLGWEVVSEHVVRALAARSEPPVFVLWGTDARALVPVIRAVSTSAAIVQSVHPSPLSASRGFFGSKPFRQVNAHLIEAGHQPINWNPA